MNKTERGLTAFAGCGCYIVSLVLMMAIIVIFYSAIAYGIMTVLRWFGVV